MSRFAWILIGMVLLCGCDSAEMAFDDPRVRELIPGTDKTVGYFVFHNNSAQSLTIVGASSEHVGAIEIHETSSGDDGMVGMRRLQSVSVPAEAQVAFEPGGKHLMLFRVGALAEPLPISLELQTEAGEARAVDVAFRVFSLAE